MTKTSLLIGMIERLRARPGITVPELAASLGRSERTIYRWLNEISSQLHMRVRCRDGGYYLIEGPSNRVVDLTPHELLALRLSLKSSPFGDRSPVAKWAESAWRKIRDSAPRQDLEDLDELAATHSVQVTAPPADIRPGLVELIERAVDDRSRLRVTYRSQKSGQAKHYVIDPYGIAFRRHSWYVVAYSQEHTDVIQLKLVRFMEAAPTGAKFERPKGFSVDRFFQSSWESWAGDDPITVRVRFSAAVAGMISEVRRHPTQVVHPQLDGSAIFEATVSGIREIAIWILGYGKDAEVLEPESLRHYIRDHVRGLASVYSITG